jgi:hypothetical protein
MANDDPELSGEQAAEVFLKMLQEAAEKRKNAAPSTPVFTPATEREEKLYEFVQFAVHELEEVKDRMNAIEEFLLLKYRGKDLGSH